MTSSSLFQIVVGTILCTMGASSNVYADIVAGTPIALRFSDPGFELAPIESGGHTSLMLGWDYRGVNNFAVEPHIPHSSSPSSAFQVRSATFPPYEGSQYASTYAGAGLFGESLYFPSQGTYEISCYAASPTGSIFLSHFQPITVALVAADFTFQLNRTNIGQPIHIVPGTTWTRYSEQFQIPAPGNYELGVKNLTFDSYFINFDSFSIELLAVPEPTCSALVFLVIPAAVMRRRRQMACFAKTGPVVMKVSSALRARRSLHEYET